MVRCKKIVLRLTCEMCPVKDMLTDEESEVSDDAVITLPKTPFRPVMIAFKLLHNPAITAYQLYRLYNFNDDDPTLTLKGYTDIKNFTRPSWVLDSHALTLAAKEFYESKTGKDIAANLKDLILNHIISENNRQKNPVPALFEPLFKSRPDFLEESVEKKDELCKLILANGRKNPVQIPKGFSEKMAGRLFLERFCGGRMRFKELFSSIRGYRICHMVQGPVWVSWIIPATD